MILLVSASLFIAAIIAYGYRSRWLPANLLLLYLAASVHLADRIVHPASPALFWTAVGLGAILPLVLLAIVALDARFGLFSLDTFFGIVPAILLSPVLLAMNIVFTILEAMGAG